MKSIGLKKFNIKNSLFYILLMAFSAVLLFGCSKDSGRESDLNPPVIVVIQWSVEITGVEELCVKGSELFVGDKRVAAWKDDVSENCTVKLTFNGVDISSGMVPTSSGPLVLTVSDASGNSSSYTIELKMKQFFPEVKVALPTVNVFGGVKVDLRDSELYLDDKCVATWSDQRTERCKVSLSFNGVDVKNGGTLNDAGVLSVTVTNDQGNSTKVVITVTCDAIFGLETIRNMQIRVDKVTNLLVLLTFADGVELVKVEMEVDGKRTVISDPAHFTPTSPGPFNLIFTVKDKNGNTTEIRVDGLNVGSKVYTEASIKTADMISETYPWYNNLQKSTKDFIYPHLIASYATCNWSKQDNRVHIIMGETANTDDIENIGHTDSPSEHAYEGYYRIRALSPGASIKGCHDLWSNLEIYINQHPNCFFLVSCAADTGGGRDWEKLNGNPDTAPQRRMLEKENVILIIAGGNGGNENTWKSFNESVVDGTNYGSCSINSKLNNKITVCGYNSWGSDNYFSPRYWEFGGLRSSMPVGFNKDNGNIVMPMIPFISSTNREDKNTDSSFPTAVTSGVVGNATSVVMANHPGITLEDAMTIIVKNYLIEEKFQYMDETTNYELVDGDYWYFIDINKLLKEELLKENKINSIRLNKNQVELPNGQGICYMGKGILFEYGGKTYETTSDNQSIMVQALKSGYVRWYWSKSNMSTYGDATTSTFNVYVVDKKGQKIPDLSLSVIKNIE